MDILKKHSRLYFYFVLMIFVLIGCQRASPPLSAEEAAAIQASFTKYTDEIFQQEVQSNAITLNYTLAHPENYGIKTNIQTLGEYSVKQMKEDLLRSENYLSTLKTLRYDALKQQQQITYDILEYCFELDLELSDFLLHGEPLGSSSGIQAQLPVLLAEYNFRNKQCITDYLAILDCIPSYFDSIIAYEQEKANAGLFMNQFAVESIIEQCKDFIENPENNLLISIFKEKLEQFSSKEELLSDTEKIKYETQNKELILKKLIPSYKKLISSLEQLKTNSTNFGGLCKLPNGIDYYKYLVKAMTGSNKSIKDISKLLDKTIQTNDKAIAKIVSANPSVLESSKSYYYTVSEPEKIMDYLKANIEVDFPSLPKVNHSIKYVHESLEDYLSPAFYLVPALDDFSENSIYINRNPEYDLSKIFPTIAHEGYPGHLYQAVYYNSQQPAPIRSMLNFGGYSEGWGTYAEIYSYSISGLEPNLATILQLNSVSTLCLYAKLDIGIHAEGWDISKIKVFLSQYGIADDEVIQMVYEMIVQEPANYLKYTLGYLEFMELRKKAKKVWTDSYSLKKFHTFVLSFGSAPFSILEKYLTDF